MVWLRFGEKVGGLVLIIVGVMAVGWWPLPVGSWLSSLDVGCCSRLLAVVLGCWLLAVFCWLLAVFLVAGCFLLVAGLVVG